MKPTWSYHGAWPNDLLWRGRKLGFCWIFRYLVPNKADVVQAERMAVRFVLHKKFFTEGPTTSGMPRKNLTQISNKNGQT